MNTTEQNNIDIYYQDTNIIYLIESDVSKLAEIYKNKYSRHLIGNQMTQFNCDFDSIPGDVGEIISRKLITLGMKSYLDIFVDEESNEGYHARMRGVPKLCFFNKCQCMGITVEELYERFYQGEEIKFDLTDGTNCFSKANILHQIILPQFYRTMMF